MTNYSKGKIYYVRSNMTDKVYIGSTTQSLSTRMGKHRNQYRNFLEGKLKRTTKSIEICKYPDAYIELIEFYPCSCREELDRREGEIQRKHDNRVNIIIAGRTDSEYYIDNKEKLAIQMKKYREEHKEELDEYRKVYREENRETLRVKQAEFREEHKEELRERDKKTYECCGEMLNWRHKARHEKTQKHQNFINSKL